MPDIADIQVFWDAFGLDNPYSGVFNHGFRMAEALRPLGVEPILVGEGAVVEAFWPGHDFRCLPGVVGILVSKVGWMIRSTLWFTAHRPQNATRSIVHGLSNWNLPLWGRTHYRKVLTVHDLIPLLAPDSVSRAYYWQFRLLLPLALKAADRVVCVSEWTRQTLVERYPSVRDKVVVIPNGFPEAFERAARRRSPPDLDQPLVCLTVSRCETYKNLGLIVEMLNRLRHPTRWTVVTDEAGMAFLEKVGSEHIRAGALVVRQGVSQDALATLYAGADLYVHPSQFEGFCLPAAEAMARGTPVIHMAGSAIDEVVGVAGTAMPRDATADEWARAMVALASRAADPEWAAEFEKWVRSRPTWSDAALALSRVYDSLSV